MKEYFSHDYNARYDLKIRKLLTGEGAVGLGVYWCIVEILYESGGRIDFDYIPAIAFDLQVEETLVKNVVENYDLFTVENNQISLRVGEKHG